MLWKSSLVMYDSETQTLWSHLIGQAMAGPLVGNQLDQIPSVISPWKAWRVAHPKGTVAILSDTAREFSQQIITERLDAFVLGIQSGEKSRSWSLASLAASGPTNDVWQELPVVAVFDVESATARLFSRNLDGRTLVFSMTSQGRLADAETRSIWHPVTGTCIEGELKGKSLSALPAYLSYKDAWNAFHEEPEH